MKVKMMEYTRLTAELMETTKILHRCKEQKHIDEFMKGEAYVLQHLAQSPQPVLPGDISAAMGITTARIAAALNNLEDKGFITRKADETDRRKVLVELTPKGKEVAAQRKAEIAGYVEHLLRSLGEEDAAAYVRIMARLAEIAQRPRE